ncbi:MAG: hypothetical protein H6642_03985 [Caldilineaceae bacterium]|nr:hypothetical protein [Caldilineaceae bacterium]
MKPNLCSLHSGLCPGQVGLLLTIACIAFFAGCMSVNEPAGEVTVLPALDITPDATAMPDATVAPTATQSAAATKAEADATTPKEADVSPSPTPVSARDALILRARTMLAEQLGLSPDSEAITLVEATAREWRNSGLGCPQGGMNYMQVITPGYQIILEADGVQYDYRTRMDPAGPVRLCTGQASAPPKTNR